MDWTLNYYLGQEHPNLVLYPDGTPEGTPNLPTFPGTPFVPIVNPPMGKLNIIDTYATIQASAKLEFAAEGDDVIERLYTNSAPAYTW